MKAVYCAETIRTPSFVLKLSEYGTNYEYSLINKVIRRMNSIMVTHSIPDKKALRDKKLPIIKILFHRLIMFSSLKLMAKPLHRRVK